jgi:hypothetical protein
MLRDTRTMLEGRLEALLVRKRAIDTEAAASERQLARAQERYRARVAYWRAAGPDAIMTPEDRAASQSRAVRAFRRAVVAGAVVSLAGSLFLMFMPG